MDRKELLSLIALQHIPGVGSITAKRLVEIAGNATALFEHRTAIKEFGKTDDCPPVWL